MIRYHDAPAQINSGNCTEYAENKAVQLNEIPPPGSVLDLTEYVHQASMIQQNEGPINSGNATEYTMHGINRFNEAAPADSGHRNSLDKAENSAVFSNEKTKIEVASKATGS